MLPKAAYRLGIAMLAFTAGAVLLPPAGAEPSKPAASPADARKAGASGKLDLSKPYGYHLQPILESIKASPEQREKITGIVMSYRSTIQPLRDQYKVKQQEFINVMVSGGATELIMAKQLELGHLYSDIVSKYCLMKLEIRRLLTPQQILQFESYGREHGWNR